MTELGIRDKSEREAPNYGRQRPEHLKRLWPSRQPRS